MFEVTIKEIMPNPDGVTSPVELVRYTQTVDALDMAAVMQAVNRKPRKPRERKAVTQ